MLTPPPHITQQEKTLSLEVSRLNTHYKYLERNRFNNATVENYTEFVYMEELLLDGGDRHPLTIAVKNGQEALALGLLEHHVHEIDVNTGKKWTPLTWAVVRNNKTLVKCLLDHGADPDHEDVYGRTPLIWGCLLNHTASIESLLEKCPNPYHKNLLGNTALDVARILDNFQAIHMLEAYVKKWKTRIVAVYLFCKKFHMPIDISHVVCEYLLCPRKKMRFLHLNADSFYRAPDQDREHVFSFSSSSSSSSSSEKDRG